MKRYNNDVELIGKRMILFYILITLLITGCRKEWLEAKADKKQAVPATIKDFQAMLDDYTAINRATPFLNEYAADGFYLRDNDFNSIITSSFHYKNAYVRAELEPYVGTTGLSSQFTGAYSVILNMNVILTESKKTSNEDKEGLSQVRAQALFQRARMYFNLSQSFIPPYNSTTANSELGLPLRLSTDITEPSVRSTVKQTYDQIIRDLLEAKEILPDVPLFLTRASKPAVLGLLAKVYLAMGDYKNALMYANAYLKVKNELLDYNTISKTATFIGVNKEVAFLSFIGSISNHLIEQTLFDSYDNEDLRKQVFFQITSVGITFKGTYGNTRTDIFAGIATDEMYLIRAEGYARSGDISAAMKDLNDLLRTRWIRGINGVTTYVDQSAATEIEALNKILFERRKQLILRNVRWTDIRRLNQEDRFKITLTRTVNGNTYVLEPNSYRYTFPIPYDVIQKSGIQQNSGW